MFSMKPKIVYDMLDYVIEEPSTDSDEKRMYKFPFMAAEVLNTEVNCLMDPFFIPFDPTAESTSIIVSEIISEEAKESELIEEGKEFIDKVNEDKTTENKEERGAFISDEQDDICVMGIEEDQQEANPHYTLENCDSVILNPLPNIPTNENKGNTEGEYKILEKLLSFIKVDTEVNSVLAGYFEKVVQALLNSRKTKMLNYLLNSKEHMQNLLKHCYNQSIADLLGRILKAEEDITKDELFEKKQSFIEAIISSIVNGELPLEIAKASYKVLIELSLCPNLLEFLTSELIVCRICTQIINENEELASAALDYLASLIKAKSNTSTNDNSSVFSSYTTPFRTSVTRNSLNIKIAFDAPNKDCKTIVTHCLNYLKPLKDKLETKPTKYLPTQFNTTIPICSPLKFSIIELVHTLVRLKDVEVARELETLEYPKVLLDLIQIHYMSSYLHSRIYQIFSDALTSKLEPLVEAVNPLFILVRNEGRFH